MAEKSIFDRGGSGQTRGGLDRFLGPKASEYLNLPPAIDGENTTPDEPAQQLDCAGKDASEPVCEIAKAEEAERENGANAT